MTEGSEVDRWKQMAIQAEERLASLSRLYELVARVGQTIATARSSSGLLRRACELLAADHKFDLVWAALRRPNTDQVEPHAHAGDEQGFLSTEAVIEALEGTALGPTRRAVLTGVPVLVPNVAEVRQEAWAQEALSRGVCSISSFPLTRGGKPIGAITLCSKRTGPLQPEIVHALHGAVYSISAALERLTIEEELRSARDFLQALLEGSPVPIIAIGL